MKITFPRLAVIVAGLFSLFATPLIGQEQPIGSGLSILQEDSSNESSYVSTTTSFNAESAEAAELGNDVYHDICAHQNWTITAGGVIFNRLGNNGTLFTGPAPGVGDIVPGTGVQSGFTTTAIKNRECNDLEIGVMAFGSSSQPTLGLILPDSSLNSNPPVTMPGTGALISYYGSNFFSFEGNLRRPIGERLTLLAGLRFVSLEEQYLFAALAASPPQAMAGRLKTNNGMGGIQFGADGTVWQCNRFKISALGKGGIYYNDAKSENTIIALPTLVPFSTPSDNPTAFLGQAELAGTYQVTSNFGLRLGYQTLWLDRVALAPAQVNSAGSDVNTTGHVFWHGASFQAVLGW